MRLQRELEPEIMDTAQEASDYDGMDHSQVNAVFCDDLLAVRADPGRVLDVGTGTALIPVALCRRAANVRVEATDLAAHMLAVAERNVAAAGLGDRVHISRRDAKATGWPPASFDTVMSNSIVHHIPEPADVLREMAALTCPGGLLFVRDLKRPEADARVRDLVALHAAIPAGLDAEARARHVRQRDLFEASLRAALTVDEIRACVASVGIPADAVATTSDRHWTLSWVKS